MRKSLVIMSIMGLSATYVNAAVQQTFEPPAESFASSNNASLSTNTVSYAAIYNESKTLAISNSTQLTKKVDVLTEQMGSKENKLSSLAEQTIEKYEQLEAAPMVADLAAAPAARLDGSAPPAVAATRARRAAHSKTVGLCARYVRKALQSAGYKFTPNASAYQYATRGTLKQAGFVKISNNTPPQVGDIVVYNRSSKHRHGHIQIFDGKNWVSDFVQRKKSPYSGNYSYTTWRDARYLDNASNEGIYLAMED